MDKKSILINQIQQLLGVEGVTHICISPESDNFMVVEIYFDPSVVKECLNTEEVVLRNYNAAVRRKQINDETTFIDFRNKLREEVKELSDSWNSNRYLNSPGQFDASELADISHVCDSIALHYGINLQAEKEAKMLYNEQRID